MSEGLVIRQIGNIVKITCQTIQSARIIKQELQNNFPIAKYELTEGEE